MSRSVPRSAIARFLRAVSVAYVGFGLVFAAGAWAPTDAPALLLLDLLDWPLDGAPGALDGAARLTSAIGGGITVALALLMLLVVAPELERGNPPVARGAAIALLGWFAVDGAGSIAAGAASNALFNVPFLLAWLVPVLLLGRREGAPVRAPIDQDASPAANQAAVASSSA